MLRRLVFLLGILAPLVSSAEDFLVWPARNTASRREAFPLTYIQDEMEPRSTLMRWNSSAEVEGGPPGWDDALASDRPDFTEASSTVGIGKRQLEMGYTYFRDDDGTTRTTAHSFPEFLFRWGILADWFEFRLGWNFGTQQEAFNPLTRSTSGSEDIYVGAKLGLTPQQGIWPEMALMPQMSVPVGGPNSDNRVLPGVNWLYGWDVNEFLSAAGSTQANIAVDESSDDEFLEFAQSWTFGYTLAERWGAYTEWFAIIPAGAETTRTQHYLDGGITFRWSNNLQYDVRIGKGISGASTDLFAGAGAVVRW